jgi:hypothetical protein
MNLTNEFEVFDKEQSKVSTVESNKNNYKTSQMAADEQRINTLLRKITTQIES